MTEASIVAEPAYDQVLTLTLERCLVDGMAPPLVVCLVGITGAAHVLRYRPPDLLGAAPDFARKLGISARTVIRWKKALHSSGTINSRSKR